jgi:hypothetical protein
MVLSLEGDEISAITCVVLSPLAHRFNRLPQRVALLERELGIIESGRAFRPPKGETGYLIQGAVSWIRRATG